VSETSRSEFDLLRLTLRAQPRSAAASRTPATFRIANRKLFVHVARPCDYTAARKIMTPNKVLWIYIILLVIGGLIGFLKAKSQVSLIMSVSFAAALSLCAAGIIFKDYVADILLALLLVVFAARLAKTKKFMPSGLMLVITILALMFRHISFR
jgi:uncharacterized membrane protein (UPF0136 family)